MEKKKLDWIISIIREEMTTGSTSGAPGFSGSADPKGPVAGFDPMIGGMARRKKGPQIKLPAGSRKRWKK
jgi:hypothetical protein